MKNTIIDSQIEYQYWNLKNLDEFWKCMDYSFSDIKITFSYKEGKRYTNIYSRLGIEIIDDRDGNFYIHKHFYNDFIVRFWKKYNTYEIKLETILEKYFPDLNLKTKELGILVDHSYIRTLREYTQYKNGDYVIVKPEVDYSKYFMNQLAMPVVEVLDSIIVAQSGKNSYIELPNKDFIKVSNFKVNKKVEFVPDEFVDNREL